jgi:flagellar hook-length control protein FliK
MSAMAAAAVRPHADDNDHDATVDDGHVGAPSTVGVANRATPIERGAPAAPVAPSTRPVEVPAHQQITAAVGTLRQRGDGAYHVSVHLHPADLGPVDLDVQLHHDSIELHMHAEHEHARELLTDHIGDIRRELEQLGLQATTVDVGDGNRRRQPPAFATTPAFTAPAVDEVAAAIPSGPAGQTTMPSGVDAPLDVRI